jgi:nitroreductase
MSDIMDHIYRRRSIRKYKDQKVEKEKLELLLKAAMAAPSAMNIQPWEFVVLTLDDTLDKLRQGLEYGHYNAPAAIIVCKNQNAGRVSKSEPFWVQDCSAATENILIAAAGLDLGTVWIAVYPRPEVITMVSQIAALPENVTPLNVIYVGYPAEQKDPRTQYEAGRVHWETY